MNRKVPFFATFLACLLVGPVLYGQCEPDTAGCKDVNEPGEICPRYLPEATVNVEYDTVITIIPPGSFSLGGSTLIIGYILVDSITNLPEGIGYEANAERMYADVAYCFRIHGTPVTAGTYPLSIFITPFIVVPPDTVPSLQVRNDTSVVMKVNWPAGIDPRTISAFRVLPNIPNPFSEVTRIGFHTPFDDRVELQVFNILGERMYEELLGVPPGDHYFLFDGASLEAGTYFYRVTNRDSYYTGKFIKVRR